MLRTFGRTILIITLAGATPSGQPRPLECDDSGSHRPSHCEIREDSLAGGNPLDIDAGRNGGIRVHGWDRGDVLVRTRVRAYADTDEEARRLAAGVRIETAAGRIRAIGPGGSGDERHWSVSFEVHVPQRSQLQLRTLNGGISIGSLDGQVQFRATNGGVSLRDVAGDVRGSTTNGGLTIELSGDRWQGAGLDVETRNGGVRLTLPAAFSAELETGTQNGRLDIDFPVTVQGLINGREVTTTLGAGGPRIRAITRNGGVKIRRHPTF